MNRSLLPVLMSLLFNVCFLGSASLGAGPSRVAVIDYSSWPYELNTRDDLNCASRLTILSYVNAISKLDTTSTALNVMLGLKNADSASVVKWKNDTYALCKRNFHDASVNSGVRTVADYGPVNEIDQLRQYAANVEKSLPDELKNWYLEMDQFTRAYVFELARLAAGLPKLSSEIISDD
jgi:hypothetical protein